MGRNKEFSTEEVLGKALNVFWQKGFEGTSISDLTEEMGIQRASLYGTFGSKEELFEEAILNYQRQGQKYVEQLLSQGGNPIESLRAVLYTAAIEPSSGQNGCFCVNTAVEVAPQNPQIAKLLKAHFDKVEAMFARVVAAGQAEGKITLTISPMEAGAYLLSCLHGLHVAAKTTPDPAKIKLSADLMLRALTNT